MTIEMSKGSDFYLGKDIDGPYEAICPAMHSAFIYNLTHPRDEKSCILVCADCSELFEKNEKAYRKSVK